MNFCKSISSPEQDWLHRNIGMELDSTHFWIIPCWMQLWHVTIYSKFKYVFFFVGIMLRNNTTAEKPASPLFSCTSSSSDRSLDWGDTRSLAEPNWLHSIMYWHINKYWHSIKYLSRSGCVHSSCKGWAIKHSIAVILKFHLWCKLEL